MDLPANNKIRLSVRDINGAPLTDVWVSVQTVEPLTKFLYVHAVESDGPAYDRFNVEIEVNPV